MSTSDRNYTRSYKRGLVIDYLNAIGEILNTTFNFTHRSGGADKISTNICTAVVYDVQVEISVMTASILWVTLEWMRPVPGLGEHMVRRPGIWLE